jgi:hypothetical protein
MNFSKWNSSNCPNLPSAHAVCNVMNGDPEGWKQVVQGTLARAGFIGVGIFLAGERDPKRLVTYSLAGAAAIEVAVVRFLWQQRSTPSAAAGSLEGPTTVESPEERSTPMYGAYEYTPDPTHIREALLNEGMQLPAPLVEPLPIVGISPVYLGGAAAVGTLLSYAARSVANSREEEAHQTAMLVGGAVLYTLGVIAASNAYVWMPDWMKPAPSVEVIDLGRF